MGPIRRTLPLLLLAATTAAFCQANLTIQNNKPDSPTLNLPYSSDYGVSSTQHLADGTTIVHRITGHAARSSTGVERLEGTAIPTTPTANQPPTQIWLLDRTQHTAIMLNTKLKTAVINRLPADATAAVAFLPTTPGQAPARLPKPENLTTENLGTKTQDGINLLGHRVTGTIPTGAVGNEEPFIVTIETWTAPQLKLLVGRTERDPRVGETHLDLTNIHTDGPDATLFQIPPGYKVTEQPATPPPVIRPAPKP